MTYQIYNKLPRYLTNPGISIFGEMQVAVSEDYPEQQLQSIHQIQNQNNLIFLLCMFLKGDSAFINEM